MLLLVALCPGAATAVERGARLSDRERICRDQSGTCLQGCITGSRSQAAYQSCQRQCTADLDTCREQDTEADAKTAPSGPALDEAGIKALARRIHETSDQQREQVARVSMTPPPECLDKVMGMIRDPRACLAAQNRQHAQAATGGRDTILSSLTEAEASLDSDVAALPTSQIKRYKAMEDLNRKYSWITTITRSFARGEGPAARDVALRTAAERFERKRLAANGGQDTDKKDGARTSWR